MANEKTLNEQESIEHIAKLVKEHAEKHSTPFWKVLIIVEQAVKALLLSTKKM